MGSRSYFCRSGVGNALIDPQRAVTGWVSWQQTLVVVASPRPAPVAVSSSSNVSRQLSTQRTIERIPVRVVTEQRGGRGTGLGVRRQLGKVMGLVETI